jgi:uncharacterized protein YyaL (SSP411 family)
VANRLASESSPYLLQHAENPVDWYPWGEDALARAREEGKPIFLSVGYAACHWCHVMAHESFEDPDTAALVNERFVPVKVDREERPDVDGLYMDAVVALTGQGGWPLSVFLTPDGRPFWGGTYFPPVERHGLPSFRQVLEAISEAWAERGPDLERQANVLTEAIRDAARRPPSGEPLTTGLLTGAVSGLAEAFDAEWGGFGRAPKFPAPSSLEFLLRMAHGHGDERALAMARTTLDAMAAGGMYDLVGGGFHRYSVDEVWLVPHFEKMLYDNALLASAYLHAWSVTGEERYRRVVEETLDYVLRELRLPEGGFASAQDADTEGVEGLTYTWTPDEVAAVLGEPHEDWLLPFEGGRFVLRGSIPDGDRAALLAARGLRPQPDRDDKALAAWNGLALSALAEAGLRLGRDDYLEAAQAVAAFLLGPLSDERGRLRRSFRAGTARIDGYLDDYAAVAAGLLDLYEATAELRWLEEARRLALLAVELFEDPDHGGFFLDPADGDGLVARRKELDDNPVPSGNALIAGVLLRLARLWGDDELERRAVGVFRLAHPLLVRAPSAVGQLLAALDFHFALPREVAVVGPPGDPATVELRRAVLGDWDPNRVVAFSTGASDPAAEAVPLLAGKDTVDGRPAVYVCERFACRAPVTSVAEVQAAQAQGGRGGSVPAR